MRKRSVVLDGHRTSIALEPEFLLVLDLLAERRNESFTRLVSRADRERAPTTPLSSALRVLALSAAQEEITPASDGGETR